LIHELAPEQICASPVHVGSGQVRCAHGILPVPTPATALLLAGVPSYGGEIRGELCTPTGAALLRHFVLDGSEGIIAGGFGKQPLMATEQIGYGCGKKDFPQGNFVRTLVGESIAEDAATEHTDQTLTDEIIVLSCNLDDMTPERIAFASETLMQAGARDVFTTSIGMKKGRPGCLLTVLCDGAHRQEMVTLLFRHTTTLGIREERQRRYILNRSSRTIQTPSGPVRIKETQGYGVKRSKPEYEDMVHIASAQGKSLAEIEEEVRKAENQEYR
ncbi:MAG: LarC family nickel insertion protein, partial [Butyrivibrio sp.]|nr:LarC family nickel insertion protein [Butyrivibrio sp.]